MTILDHQRYLKEGEALYLKGDKAQIPHCLDYCLRFNVPIPHWLLRAWNNAYQAITASEFKSWDDVFGKPLRKGKRQTTARRDKEIALDLFRRVQELRAIKTPTDYALFKTVGAEFGIGATAAKNIYYSFPKRVRASLFLAESK